MSDRAEEIRAHMAEPTSDVAIRRQWGAIDRALEKRSRPWRRPLIVGSALAVAAAAALVIGVGSPDEALTTQAGARLTAGASPLRLVLSDGSVAELDPDARIHVLRDGEGGQVIDVEAGTVHFDVVPRGARTFEVLAQRATVRVLGTRFSVTLDEHAEGAHLVVEVEHGHVRVSETDRTHDLLDGQRLSVHLAPPAPLVEATLVEDATRDDVGEDVASSEDAVTAPEPAPRPRPRGSRANEGPSAEVLFAQAQAARREGRHADAASLYAELAREHPADRRAGLAAFEHGRLLLDPLGDTAGAVRAFTRAASMRGPQREDAQARLVEAYERAHDRRMCLEAQRTYLARYPHGVHVERVRARCAL